MDVCTCTLNVASLIEYNFVQFTTGAFLRQEENFPKCYNLPRGSCLCFPATIRQCISHSLLSIYTNNNHDPNCLTSMSFERNYLLA